MREYPGGCACGAVRCALKSGPMIVHCCHCKECQRQTGSAFVINALIDTDRVAIYSGETTPFSMPTDSGRPPDVVRCTQCGTAVWSDYGGQRALRFVRVGTLDDPTALEPDVHIYTRSKQPWVRLPDGAQVFEAFYDPKSVWRPESRARYAALQGKG